MVITGAGRAFSSGADLKDLGVELTPEGRPNVYGTLTEIYHPIMHAIRELPKPVLARVNGPAVGIGCSLALCCDLIVAAQSAYFLLAFVNIGLVPDGGSSLFVPTRVGFARATEMAMLGERIGASRPGMGPISRAVPGERLTRRSRRSHSAWRTADQLPMPAPSAFNSWLYRGWPAARARGPAQRDDAPTTSSGAHGVCRSARPVRGR